jgi:hypothetical protein
VNIEEWLFAFSKLIVCDQNAFDKFMEDYEEATKKNGRLK